MGMFDWVHVSDPRFVCSEGHDLRCAEFQTKDLDCTLGTIDIGDRVEFFDGPCGPPEVHPYTGTFNVGANCSRCPVFVQAETFNVHPVSVDFDVEVAADVVVSITRTGPTSAEQIAEAPTLEYMPNCRGPMSMEDGNKRKMDRKFFPWDPTPTVSAEVAEKQRAWSERMDAFRKPRPARSGDEGEGGS